MEAAREELDKTIGEKLKEAYTDYRKDHLKQKLLPHTFFIFEWLKKDLSYHRACLSSYPVQLRAVLDEVLSAMIDSDDPYVRCFWFRGPSAFSAAGSRQMEKKPMRPVSLWIIFCSCENRCRQTAKRRTVSRLFTIMFAGIA